jgi:uncharacterized membrane protein (UPF0136 family)
MHEVIMIKKSSSWTALIYGLILIWLGYLGYHDAGSRISFYMGGGFGALMILSSLLMFRQIKFGAYSAVFLSLILTATFSLRYSLTQKELPAILSVISAGTFLFLLIRTTRWNR